MPEKKNFPTKHTHFTPKQVKQVKQIVILVINSKLTFKQFVEMFRFC